MTMNATSSRIGIALAVVLGGLVLTGAGGCNIGQEGERCNPSLTHDECGPGLACTAVANCPETYCCPTSGTSSNPYCQPGCSGGDVSFCAAGGDASFCNEGGEGGGDGGDGGASE
jgi:hypothetical protein